MSLTQAVLLFAAAILGGVLNALAGGGGFVFFPALIFAGLPSVSANATSKIVSWPGLLAGMWAYRRELATQGRRVGAERTFWLLGAVTAIGGLVGASLLLRTSPRSFDRLVPWLLLAATLLFAFGPPLVARFGPAAGRTRDSIGSANDQRGPLALTLHFLAAVYGGFYGGGIGILILAILGLLGMEEAQEMNALKMFLMVTLNALAVAAFVTRGAVAWPHAVVMMAGSALGGYGGAWCTRRLPEETVRWTVIAAGSALTVYFFLRR